ncbi:glycosyltransferase [Microterricola pindariensis]|uniref:Glycosyltransferase n=1 Tax=Microterricola pindariensis TaxID=478010 RepID=A0ABX5B0L4_9MICO|nr:glycosyltransferase [Microterricola pindariensis]PPL20181.1 hypothetical protein GY24_02375 [Microterricola pindariensis]
MSPRVTAILIARNGAQHLDRTLAALAAQTRRPDTVIMVDCGGTDATAQLLAAAAPTQLIAAEAELSFGDAVALAVQLIPEPSADDELLWLLGQDTAPEPGALAALVNALEVAPSVAVAGPKLMDWERADYIREFGETMTRYGRTVTVVGAELDQAQHDDLSDVLAVASAGMLVRHHVWQRLGGFDPALPVVDNALDFCVRTRLSGHRVSLVPAARVAVAGDGITGADSSQEGSAVRKRVRLRRQAQLHRRLVYAPAAALLPHWLSLVPLAFLRAFLRLMRKEPGSIGAEFGAAFGAAFSGRRVPAARRRLRRTRTLGWGAIASLRMPGAEVRRRKALLREQHRTLARGSRSELAFLSTGGGWTLIGAGVAGVALLAPLLGASALVGGGLLPVNSPAALWQNIGYGWRDIGTGFVGAADPFAAVLAVLGSLTFWSPSALLLCLYFAALPLAALGAWLAAARLSGRGSLRALAAVLWMLAPTFISAIADGRPAPMIAHILLPWLFFAAAAAGRSWSASAASALLFAAIVACVPSLAPALLVLWAIAVAFSGRSIMRFIGIPIPAVVLVAPLLLQQAVAGNWWGLLADPGVPLAGAGASSWQLLLGFPNGGFGGWGALVAMLGLPEASAALLAPILLAPLVVLAVLALFLRGSRLALLGLLTALLGYATAVAALQISVSMLGEQSVPIWPGGGLSLYWAGLIGAAVIGLNALGRAAAAPALVAGVALFALVLPLAGSLALGAAAPQPAAVHSGDQRILPAFVTAEAQADPRAGTLVLVPQPNGAVLAQLQRGAGTRLDDQSTLFATDTTLSAEEQDLAELAGNLSSRSGFDARPGMDALGIHFVLLEPGADSAAARDTARRAASSLDGNAVLVPVGQTDFGALWRYQGDAGAAADGGAIPPDAGGWFGQVVLWSQLAVFGFVLLLSIPTGAGRDAPRGRATPAAAPAVARESEQDDER